MPVSLCRARRQGFTLTEAAIILGILGLIIGAIWGASSAVRNSQMDAKAAADVMRIVENLRATNGRPTFAAAAGTDVTTNMIAAGVITPENVGTAAQGRTAFDTPLFILIDDEDTFTVRYTAVPRSACAALIMTVANGERMGAQRISGTGFDFAVNGPVTLAAATAACNAGGNPVAQLDMHFDLH